QDWQHEESQTPGQQEQEERTQEETATGHAEEQWKDAAPSGVCMGPQEDADAERDDWCEQCEQATQDETQAHDAQQDLQ
ncbi:unnamed protein product, partial [Closterium sp. NIES-54]